jgi:hypothetical protein
MLLRLLPGSIATLLLTLASSAQAHPGHGATEAWHWHASDTSGFLMVALLAGLAIWFSRED